MILYYLVVFVLCVWVDQVLHLLVKDELYHFPYLVHWLYFDSVLNMINLIRYPSKPDSQTDHDNYQTVLSQTGYEHWKLLQPGQHPSGGHSCDSDSLLLFWLFCILQDQSWVST